MASSDSTTEEQADSPAVATPSAAAASSDGMEGPGISLDCILRLLEEQGQIGFWWHDLATDRISVSPGLSRITGLPVNATRARDSLLRQIHPQDQPYQADQLDLIDRGQPLRREFRIVRPDGTIRWVSSRIDVVLGDDGRPVRFIGVVADINDRREAQRAVEFNQGRRAALVEAMCGLTWISDLSGRSVDHGAWCRLTGMAPENCDGEGWLDAVHPNDRDRVRGAYRTAVTQGTLYNIDYRVLIKAGQYRWYNARSAPVRDPSGLIREWQGILLPIDGDHRPVDEVPGIDGAMPLTGEQIRGARGLLDWSLAQLASASGVSVSTIKRMEDGSEGSTRPSKAEAVRRALETGGVSFRIIDGATWIGRSA